MTTLYITILFLTIIIIPGFFLKQIFKIWTKEKILDQICLSLILGFFWNMLIVLIAIITGLNILSLEIFYYLAQFLLLAVFIFLERKSYSKIKLSRINLAEFIKENNIWLITIIVLISTIIIATQKGSIFEEESFFHLSIIHKAISGANLSPYNLNYIKSENLHSVYGLPIWHVFIGLFSKLSNINMFTLWQNLYLPLSIISFTIWTWLLGIILKNKIFTALSVNFLGIVLALFDNSYVLERLAVPNTLGLMILVPMILALSLKYVFNGHDKSKIYFIIIFSLFFTTIIHSLQFIYFSLIWTVFTVILGLFSINNADIKMVFKKSIHILIICLIFILGLAIIFFRSGNIINLTSQTINTNPNFNNLLLFSKISFILFPLLFLIIKKNYRLIFIFSLLIVLPIIYLPFTNIFQAFFLHFFNWIFLSRLDAYLTWDFAIWGILTGLFLFYLDNIITKFKTWQLQINIILVVIVAMIIFLEQKYQLISNFYNSIFLNLQITNFVNNYYWLLFLFVIALTAILLIWKINITHLTHQPVAHASACCKKNKVCNFQHAEAWSTMRKMSNITIEKNTSNHLSIFLTSFIIIFFFFSPSYQSLTNSFTKNYQKNDASHQKIDINSIGGQETIDFINSKIPAKSVFMAAGDSIQTLPLLTDNFMAAYPRSAKEKTALEIFNFDTTGEKRIDIISKFKINYIFLGPNELSLSPYFSKNPQYFNLIYDKESQIYQVNF